MARIEKDISEPVAKLLLLPNYSSCAIAENNNRKMVICRDRLLVVNTSR